MSDLTVSTDLAAYLPALTRLANAHLALVPPGWTLDVTQTATIVNNVARLWVEHFGDQPEAPADPLVVTRDGQLAAAAQWLRTPGRTAILAWVFADGEDSAQEVLRAAGGEAQAYGYETLWTTRHSFNIGWLGTPTAWTHLVDAYTDLGFQPISRWRIMTADTRRMPLEPVVWPAGLRLTWETQQRETNGTLWDGDTQAGEVQIWDVPGHFAGCDGYGDWTTVEWLGVEEAYQGRGLGRALLAEALRVARERGQWRVAVWTESDNPAALAVNRAVGLVDAAETIDFEGTLR